MTNSALSKTDESTRKVGWPLRCTRSSRWPVSRSRPSRMLSTATFVKPENRRRLEEALSATGYRPNLAARNLRRGRGIAALRLRGYRDALGAAGLPVVVDLVARESTVCGSD